MRLLLPLLLAAACAEPSAVAPADPVDQIVPDDDLSDDPQPQTWSLGDAMVIHSVDAELLSVVDPTTREISVRYQLGGRAGDQPTVADGKVWVTLRDERSLAMLEPRVVDGKNELVEAWRVEVGPEPRGLLVDVERRRAWVTVSMANEVVEIDLDSQEIVDEWSTGPEPLWLTALPNGDVIATCQRGEYLYRLGDSVDAMPIQLPVHHRENGARYTMRATGAPAVDADDGALWIPVLYTDLLTPLGGNVQAEETQLPPAYYTDDRIILVIPTTPRIIAALVQAPLDPVDLQGASTTIFAASFGATPVRGVLSAIYPDDSSDLVFAAVEGAKALFVSRPIREPVLDPAGPFRQHYAAAARTADGPRAFWRRGDQVWAFGFLNRQLRSYDMTAMRERVPDTLTGPATLSGEWRLDVSISVLGPHIEAGRSLFYSSIDPEMVLPGGGLACATCHIDGGTDGLTWPLEEGPRQTPTLAGVKSEQTPVTWSRSVPTVADEILLTSVNRMGGTAPTRVYAEDAATFIDSVRIPDTRPRTSNLGAIDRGREIFQGSAGCVACHRGEHLTDRNAYSMFGEIDIRTPTLRGIAATAPYFHDGSAPTLFDVVEQAEDGGMGKTNHLSRAEKRDLAEYLGSL